MQITPFKLERYFDKYEFSTKYLLSSSDCDGLAQSALLKMADQECKKLWDNLTLGYTEYLGHPLLRTEIAKLYNGISPDQIMVAVPEEAIFIALSSLLKKGDHIICTFPGYQSLYQIAESMGCEVTKWLPDEQSGWHFDAKFLRDQIKSNTKIIIFNFPHNPTGYLPTQEEFENIIQIAKSCGAYVFSDEMYRLLEYDAADRLPSACELYDKAISLFGMSKTFGLAGLRIGWLATRDQQWFADIAAFKDYTTICSSAPAEILSLIALRVKEKIISRHLKRITRNRDVLQEFLDRHKDSFSCIVPKAGTLCFPRLLTNKLSSDRFCEKVRQKARIMILPSTVYDYDTWHFRIGYGRENFPEVLNKFDAYLKTIL